ncbi:unnamed protein product [Ectocarpus sp. 12 AP-2014]
MVMEGRRLSSIFLCCCCTLSLWSQGVFGISYHVSSCKDFLSLSTPMQDDTHVIVLENITCKLPRAVIVSGPYAFLVSSELASLTFENLRFSIKDGADFFLNLSSDEYQGTVAFVGTSPQQSHGGTFKIELGASVTFGAPVIFRGSSVVAGKRGGAIYNNGYLTFEHSAKFANCSVLSEDGEAQTTPTLKPGIGFDDASGVPGTAAARAAAAVSTNVEPAHPVPHWGCGGALYNGESAQASFRDVTWFNDNIAGVGSAGGAVCNEGVASFSSRTYFTGNTVSEHLVYGRGEGGALYTAAGAVTTLVRKANFRNNRSGGEGGAIYSAGITTLQGSGVFYGNMAWGWTSGRGGHVFSSGMFEVKRDTSFRSGRASHDGGALFVSDIGEACFDGELGFHDNEAARQCHDVYDASSKIVCLSVG